MASPVLNKKDIETIVYNYFREQFVTKEIQWMPTHNNIRLTQQSEDQNINRFINVLSQLTNDFRSSEGFSQLRDQVETVMLGLDHFEIDRLEESGYTIYSGIAEHLCAEGIKWSHILTLFVFTFELAYEYSQNKNDITIVESIASWLITYVSERLLDWMNNHGGLNGFIDYGCSNHSNSTNSISALRFWKPAVFLIGISALVSLSMQLLQK